MIRGIKMIHEIIFFILYSSIIVLISKYILVKTIRKLAENLNLKAHIVGNIAGVSTSIPELLTIGISSLRGFSSVSVFNILSSNTINFAQYIGAVVLNKNIENVKNTAILTDLALVILTIIIPIILLLFNIQVNLAIIPLFIVVYLFFRFINSNMHKVYLKKENLIIEKYIEKEGEFQRHKNITTVKYIIILLIASIVLFYICEKLGNNLEKLCNLFNVSEVIIGILLGFITSIPELITFFESQKHHRKSNNEMLGIVEATNNLLTSNMINLFVIQSIGILLTNIYLLME